MDAADENASLTVLVLQVDIYTATKKEARHVLPIVSRRYVKRRREICIQQIWLSTSAVEKEHKAIDVTERGCLVQH